MNERHHEMILEQTHASGMEEWHCPICGRRFLVQWPPAYKMTILEPGDQDIRHNVSRSALRRNSLQAARVEETGLDEEFRLIPWLKWMERTDFDNRWGKNDSQAWNGSVST